MNLKLVLFCWLICLCCICHAQRTYTEDFVHLKSGRQVHGNVIIDVPGDHIILLKPSNDSLYISEDTIKYIVRHEVIKKNGRDKQKFYDLRTKEPFQDNQKPNVNKTEDRVYLKNGTTVTGHIIDSLRDGSVRIKSIWKDTLVIKQEYIDKIIRKEWIRSNGPDRSVTYPYGDRSAVDSQEEANMRSGGKGKLKMAFTAGGQFNAGWGNNKYTRDNSLFGFGISPGITFQNIVSLSANICFTQMNANDEYGPPYNNIFNLREHDYYTAQLFIELRTFPIKKGRVSPLATIAYGKGFGIFSRYLHDGDMLRAGAGFELKVAERVKLDVCYTYNYQELQYEKPYHYYLNESMPRLYLSYMGLQVEFVILIKGSRYARTFLID